VGEARGEIELDGNVLVIKRIHVRYSGVTVPADKREAADRALATHRQACPVARSIEAAIDITTDWAAPG
jgi:organic hydroperoxide reductase OsmC/OhrA